MHSSVQCTAHGLLFPQEICWQASCIISSYLDVVAVSKGLLIRGLQ